MAIAFVAASQNATTVSDGGTIAYAGSGVTAGSILVATIHFPDSTTSVTGITDTQGNTWALAKRQTSASAVRGCEIWYAFNATTGPNTLTCDWSGASNCQVNVAEWSGFDEGGSVNATAGNDNGTITTSHSLGSLTTTENDTLIVGVLAFDATFTVSGRTASFNALTAGTRRDSQYKISASTETTTGTVTTSTSIRSAGALAAFFANAIGGGGGRITNALLRMGVG